MISRLVSQLARDAPRGLKAIRTARAAARERAWALAGPAAPGAGGAMVTADIDATIVIVAEPQRCPAGGQPTCQRLPDAAARTGDERNTATE